MKITRVEAIPFKIPLKTPPKWGLTGYMEAAEHILVRVHTDSGVVGVAEATPRPTIYGESQASILLPRRPGNGVILDEEKIKKYRMD